MAKIDIPAPLKVLLESGDGDLYSPIRALSDRVGEILSDNKLPFFPDYTDHGPDHINGVLKTEVELVPKAVWESSKNDSNPRLLCDADAAVIVGATLLHDIAMHLRPDGFRELINDDSRFVPLRWFNERRDGYSVDRPWHELWDDYAREARRFDDRKLVSIIGLEAAKNWKFKRLPVNNADFEPNDFLIIGEFIRRHHARLAHEIAIYGFPGLQIGGGAHQFPAIGREEGHPLMRLADLIGLTARSHGTSLRVCQAYIDASPSYQGTPRPMGTAVLYPMALLRVADYLQIDRQRAPAVLLQLRNPQSPLSVQEWKKHLAVQNISPAKDPRGKMVTVSNKLTLELYLQLRDLLAGLQSEMDHSTAVLSETYGSRSDLGLDKLNLATRRVYSNLHSPVFRDSLPYIPERTSFAADPNLLTLLVEPLYGNEPSVGVRELIQNAVDAVGELKIWCETHNRKTGDLDLADQEADVLIDFIKRDNGTWFLRVQDKGIGMKSDTIQNYFLRAGASFRQSPEWAMDFLDDKGGARVLRAGRFGIGAFAIFLLGPNFRLWTRHAKTEKSGGFSIEASASSNLIEIRRIEGLSIGTKIEVELSSETITDLALEQEVTGKFAGPARKCSWFCWDWPKVTLRLIRDSKTVEFPPHFSAPITQSKHSPDWAKFNPVGFDGVFWNFSEEPKLVCNGIRIGYPDINRLAKDFDWSDAVQLRSPSIAVLDSACNLPLTTQRYQLARGKLPFARDLEREVTISFIAHALVCGPTKHIALANVSSGLDYHPLSLCMNSRTETRRLRQNDLLSSGRLRWCSTVKEFVVVDPWLFSLLKTESIFIFGIMDQSHPRSMESRQIAIKASEFSSHASVCWDIWLEPQLKSSQFRPRASRFISKLCQEGIAALGGKLVSGNAIISSEFPLNIKSIKRKSVLEEHISADRWEWEKLQFGDRPPSPEVEDFLRQFEKQVMIPERNNRAKRKPNIVYVADIRIKPIASEPNSIIASIWNECLGPRAIPFEQEARNLLIEHGRKHPELKRHIEAWEVMKSTGSKWITSVNPPRADEPTADEHAGVGTE